MPREAEVRTPVFESQGGEVSVKDKVTIRAAPLTRLPHTRLPRKPHTKRPLKPRCAYSHHHNQKKHDKPQLESRTMLRFAQEPTEHRLSGYCDEFHRRLDQAAPQYVGQISDSLFEPSTGVILSHLPVELLEAIAEHSDRKDFRSVRHTCRELYYKTQHWYRQSYNHRLALSLAHIEQLSKIPSLEDIGGFPVHFELICPLERRLERPKETGRLVKRRPPQSINRLEELLKTGLIKCRHVSIGFSQNSRVLAARVPDFHRKNAFPSAMFETIMRTFSIVEIPPPMVSIVLASENCRIGLSSSSRPSFDTVECKEYWARVVDLSLDLTAEGWTGDWVCKILKQASGLKALRIKIYSNLIPGTNPVNTFLSSNRRIALSNLDLCRMHLSDKSLNSIIPRLGPTLRKLRLVQMEMEWREMGSWISFIQALITGMPHLSRLWLSSLRDANGFVWFIGLNEQLGTKYHDIFKHNPPGRSAIMHHECQGLAVSEDLKVWAGKGYGDHYRADVFGFDFQGPAMNEFLQNIAQTTEYGVAYG